MGFWREIIPGIVWIFLIWLGLNALAEHEMELLGIYTFLGATGVAVFVGWLLRRKNPK
jgi:hypothetical protein